MGNGEKILNTTSTRPWSNPGRVFFCPCPYPLQQLPAACMASYGLQAAIFALVSSSAQYPPKSKTSVKAIHRPYTAFYTLMAIPIFPRPKTPHRGPQSATQGIKQPRPAPSGASRGIMLYGRLQRVKLCPECCNPCADRVRSPLLHDLPDCFTVCIFPTVSVCRLSRSLAAGRNHHLIAPHRIRRNSRVQVQGLRLPVKR